MLNKQDQLSILNQIHSTAIFWLAFTKEEKEPKLVLLSDQLSQ